MGIQLESLLDFWPSVPQTFSSFHDCLGTGWRHARQACIQTTTTTAPLWIPTLDGAEGRCHFLFISSSFFLCFHFPTPSASPSWLFMIIAGGKASILQILCVDWPGFINVPCESIKRTSTCIATRKVGDQTRLISVLCRRAIRLLFVPSLDVVSMLPSRAWVILLASVLQ